MFRITVFTDSDFAKSKTKIEERFENLEDAKKWIDNDIEPYIRDQDYHFFDSKEGEWYDFCKTIPAKNDIYFKHLWRSYLIKGHE